MLFILENEYDKFQNKKYQVELECAIQMSLALEEEKKKLKDLEDEEFIVKMIINIFIFIKRKLQNFRNQKDRKKLMIK